MPNLTSNADQVPGAELGEGGSVVDLSHIAPSVLALIQVVIVIMNIVNIMNLFIMNCRGATVLWLQLPSMLHQVPRLSR